VSVRELAAVKRRKPDDWERALLRTTSAAASKRRAHRAREQGARARRIGAQRELWPGEQRSRESATGAQPLAFGWRTGFCPAQV
jgi:hypothetical protein